MGGKTYVNIKDGFRLEKIVFFYNEHFGFSFRLLFHGSENMLYMNAVSCWLSSPKRYKYLKAVVDDLGINLWLKL